MTQTKMAFGSLLLLLQYLVSVSLAYPSGIGDIKTPRAVAVQNPITSGWYADPDAIKLGSSYWVYPTASISSGELTWFDAFESQDLLHWTKHERIFTTDASQWATASLWAPSVVKRGDKYYLFYTANDPGNKPLSVYGIGVAVGDRPSGPFRDIINHPLVGNDVNGGAAMDQQIFTDDGGKQYMLWGAGRANIAPLNGDMVSLGKWTDGSGPKDITPEGFSEGSYMLKRNGIYYFMWSESVYYKPDYRVAYGMSRSITGPFNRIGVILSRNNAVEAPGHHSVFNDGNGQYYIAYHRRKAGEQDKDHRQLAINALNFSSDGTIKPVIIT